MLLPLAGVLFGVSLGNILLAIVVLGVVVLVGRFVLHVAWRLVVLAGLVVGGLYVLSLLGF